MSSRKVILAIVEGLSDTVSLDEILNKIVDDSEVKFVIVSGDVLQKKGVKCTNVLTKIVDEVKSYTGMYKLKRNDIKRIIHIVDIDGVYIDEGHVHESNNHTSIEYKEDGIYTADRQAIIERNKKKAQLLNFISCKDTIWAKIPYAVYYFSCNLEWALHNSTERHTDEEKMDLAGEFAEKYEQNIDQFVSFINSSDLAVEGTYKETWEYIRTQTDKIQRKSNFHLFVNELLDDKQNQKSKKDRA